MLHIMIVDDSVTIRRVMKNVLGRLIKGEMTIVEAGTGVEALEKLKEHGNDIALILLDVNMPEMNGDVFLEKMRADAQYNGIRVVMVTTEAEKRTVVRIMKIGANGYIVKPFTPQTMKRALQPILGRLGIELKDVD